MPNILKHKHPWTTGSPLVSDVWWNEEHVFAGGAQGSILFRSTAASDGAAWLDDVAVGMVLLSGGPSFGKVGLATHVSGILPAANVDLTGVVPVTRTVNGHALSANVTVTAADVGLSDALLSTASYSNPPWLTSLAGSKITGTVPSATVLTTARTINGVAFDGSANIVISAAADASLLTGTVLASGVVSSSLTSVGNSLVIGNSDTVIKRAEVARLGVFAADGVTLGSINVGMGTHIPGQLIGILFGTPVDGFGGWLKWRSNGNILLARNGDDTAAADFQASTITGNTFVQGGNGVWTVGASSQEMGPTFYIGWQDAAFGNTDIAFRRRAVGSLTVAAGLNTTTTGELYLRNVRLDPKAVSKPAASVNERGSIWHTYGGSGVADTVEVCRKDAADAYAWVTLV